MTARAAVQPSGRASASRERLRVLLVPDSIHWITGTIAKSIVAHNAWVEGTIMSGAVLDAVARENEDLFASFDLVHFVCPYASKRWLPVLRDRLPCVTSHHHVSDDWELQRHNMDGDAIIAGSSQWVADAESRGAPRDRIVRVPYGIDASRFSPPTPTARRAARASLGIASDAIALGFFAKLSSNERDRKGTDVFAAAVRELHAKMPTLVVLIIGPGWDELVAQLRASGVNCVWLPFVKDGDRMPAMYQALDFYWVTARVEGGPVTLLEAMSTGLCCISTPVGLAVDIVESGVNGFVVPFGDVHAFASRTLECANDPALRARIGSQARETILATMDLPITTKGVREAYEIAIARFAERTHSAPAVASPARALAPALLERASILEELVWAEALMLQGQRAMALRIIAETWLRHPLSTLPPRFLLRNLLPPRVVRAIVRTKSGPAGARA
jgi:glycosyltransferase involved in cell wall biosynthesis